MDQIIQLLESWGLIGLIVASFAESIFSPILPDFLLIPMALANPKNAIFYGLVATVTSVVGGILGYWLGIKYGLPLVKKMVPQKYLKIIDDFTQHNAGWAVFLAAMSPIRKSGAQIFVCRRGDLPAPFHWRHKICAVNGLRG